MKITELDIPGLWLVEPVIHRDERGFFSETYKQSAFAAHGIEAAFVQDNHSMSVPVGVVRGLHYQVAPQAQGKLVRVVRGAILDVAVDIRKGSPTFGRHVAVELSAANWRQLWIPAGFAHGFCTTEPETEVIYKVTHPYAPDCEHGLAWDDPALGIAWPIASDNATLSAKDRINPRLADLPDHFIYTG